MAGSVVRAGSSRPKSEYRERSQRSFADLVDLLRQWFDADFAIWDGKTGELSTSDADLAPDDGVRSQVCREVARQGSPEFIEEEGPVLLLAIPLEWTQDDAVVAVGAFASRRAAAHEDLSGASKLLGLDAKQARGWLKGQTPWVPDRLLRMAELFVSKIRAQQRAERFQSEMRQLSDHLSSTYEEISLLYRLTQELKLSSKDKDLAALAIQWLADVVPAEGLAIQLVPTADPGSITQQGRSEPLLLVHGNCPLTEADFADFTSRLDFDAKRLPLVMNRPASFEDFDFPKVRQLIAVPLAEGPKLFGWLAAFNHTQREEFGTVEASLLSSVAAILGIHFGNAALYREQGEFLESVVRAFTSAIDAKDPYTCGHSNRVARTAVRLAQELGCDAEQVRTIYLSGLLHDIGKIGIDDQVLRKPDKLTPAEYEHIKTHTEIGYKILQGLTQLDPVLPVVLYHHEQWDGKGYPHGLSGDNIPFLARVVAVADGFDAMGSDRPYRKGMPDGKLDAIFREGAGKQWDAKVVEAFFNAREDIRRIAESERASLELDMYRYARRLEPETRNLAQP